MTTAVQVDGADAGRSPVSIHAVPASAVVQRRVAVADVSRRRGVRSTRTGASFDPLLPFEAWKELGAKLGTYSNAGCWWLGDWLAFGQIKYGRRYKEAVATTGLDYQT